MCGAIPCKLPVVYCRCWQEWLQQHSCKAFLPKTVRADSHEVTPDTWSAHKLRWDKKWRLYFVAWFLVVPISVAEKHQRLRWSRFGRCMQSCKVSKVSNFWVIFAKMPTLCTDSGCFMLLSFRLHICSTNWVPGVAASKNNCCHPEPSLVWFFRAWDENSLLNSVPKGSGCIDAMRKKRGRAARKSEVRMTRWLGSHPLDICMAVLWCKICVQFQILIDSHRHSRQKSAMSSCIIYCSCGLRIRTQDSRFVVRLCRIRATTAPAMFRHLLHRHLIFRLLWRMFGPPFARQPLPAMADSWRMLETIYNDFCGAGSACLVFADSAQRCDCIVVPSTNESQVADKSRMAEHDIKY